ncbi:MAG: hypothetical protein HY909_23410 [Deltaproteobacteria bacterium]|nr:hypothetical protein [Deltaproteobacteria bacterium]
MNLRSVLCSLFFALSVPAAASAQAPAPPVGARPRAEPVPVHASGAVARLLVGPGGRARGFALTDGTVVFVGRGAEDLASRVRPGVAVQVDGFARPGAPSIVHRATVRAQDGTVLVQAPAGPPPGARQGPRGEGHRGRFGRRGAMQARLQALPAHTSRGTVQQVVSGPHGAPRMLLLSDGSTAYLRPRLAQAVARHGVRSGDTVTVDGRGSPGPSGVGVAAERVTFADGTAVTAPAPAVGSPSGRRR